MSTNTSDIHIEVHGWGETHTDQTGCRCVMIQRQPRRSRLDRDDPDRFTLEHLAQASINRRATRLGLSRPDEWTEPELAMMRERYVEDGPGAMAMRLGRTPRAVQLQAQRMELRRRPRFEPWSQAEDDTLREWSGKIPLAQVHATYFEMPGRRTGQEFCRTYPSVAQRSGALGLTLSRRDAALLSRQSPGTPDDDATPSAPQPN